MNVNQSATEISLTAKKESKTARLLKLLLKITVTGLCFWYISIKIDFSQAWAAFRNANWLLFGGAVGLYILSKLISAYRLNIYFQNIQIHLPAWQNVKLYWLGMFYNLFLPGSISGDAYKVVLLKKKLNAPYKQTGTAVFLDRFSGLLGLGILLGGYAIVWLPNTILAYVIAGGCGLAILLSYVIIRRYFSDFAADFWRTLLVGFLVQAVQVAGVYLIQQSIGNDANQHQWMLIFLAGSVVSVLPLSLGGGLGTREVVFAKGATLFDLSPGLGVTISLLFYLTSVAGALPGASFVFVGPLGKQSSAAK